MLKMILRIFLALSILTVLTVGGLYLYNKERTYYNKENEIGNTPGNLYNGGLFVEQDGLIFFSNDYSDGALYVMSSNLTNIRQLSNDKAAFLNADGNYLYYIRAKDIKANLKDSMIPFHNSGVYRINQNGTNLKNYSGSPSTYLTLKGNDLYYLEYSANNGLDLYRHKIDRSEKRRLLDNEIQPALITDQELLYVEPEKHEFKSLLLKSYTTNTAFEGFYQYPILLEDYIYYINPNDKNKLYRMNRDGTEPTVLVKNNCSTYNITNSGKYLYYQINESKKKGIYRLDLESMKSEKLKSGRFKQIHVTDNYVFFKDYNNTDLYFMAADGASNITTFQSLLTTE